MQKGRGALVGSTVVQVLRSYRTSDDVLVGAADVPSTVSQGSLEFISWDSEKRSGPIWTTRACDHWSVNLKARHVVYSGYNDDSGGIYYKNSVFWGFDSSIPTVPDLTSYNREALDFFKTGCQDKEMSFVVSLLELSEIKTILPTLKKSFHAIMRSGASLKGTIKAIADLNLMTQFGIKPLIRDIQTLVSMADSLEKKLKWLRKNQGKPVKVSFTKSLPSASRSRVFYADSAGTYTEQVSETVHYKAFAVMQYDISSLLDWEIRLRLLNRSLGITDLVSNVFEKISYSFLLGWVMNIGSILDSIPSIFVLPNRIIDCGYSVKIETTSEAYLNVNRPKGTSRYLIAEKQTKNYLRRRGLPVTFQSIVASSDFTLNQLGLGLSLLSQKW